MKVVSPIGEIGSGRFPAAARPASLDGAVLGLLSNGKPNSANLLDEIAAQLGERYRLGEPVRANKTESAHGPAHGATEAILERLSSGTVAVLTASGD
ncbi:MAG TPA: hypothetical protein VGQ42_13640 [Candidatus Dormibacteraeota bacterium]|nr:hypothetical protein [Candidatus Dormibacteraeota bacterium]